MYTNMYIYTLTYIYILTQYNNGTGWAAPHGNAGPAVRSFLVHGFFSAALVRLWKAQRLRFLSHCSKPLRNIFQQGAKHTHTVCYKPSSSTCPKCISSI